MKGRPQVFGEVLFDHFPDGRRVLGGAPFNVAWHLQAFGLAPLVISRVGNDAEGGEVREAMGEWGLDDCAIQIDPELPTGRVEVSLAGGEPAFEIVYPCAWDAIAPAPELAPAGLLYHGTLALRDERSRHALERLRETGPVTVFLDVNLRSPWWRRDQVRALLGGADWAKLNGDELALLGSRAGEVRAQAEDMLDRYALEGVVVTAGEAGAMVMTADGRFERAAPQPVAEVRDTVGAGDAFAAVIILGLLRGWPLESALSRALDFAARICGMRGAVVRDPGFYRPLIEQWQLDGDANNNV